MSFFKKLFSTSNESESNSIPVSLEEKYGLKPYEKGLLTNDLYQKSYKETFNRFGFKGVILHSQLKSHFLYLDYVNDFFTKKSPEKINFKLNGKVWVDWNDNEVNRYDYNDLQQVLSSNKLVKTHDTSLNLDGFIERLNLQTSKLIDKISSSGFPSKVDDSNRYKLYLSKYYYVGLEESDSGVIGECFKYLFDKENLNFISEYSKYIVGWNSIYLLTPFHVIHTNHELYPPHNIVIEDSDYNWSISLHVDFTRLRKVTSEVQKSLDKWKEIKVFNYREFLKNEYKTVRKELLDFFDFESQIMSLKKNSYEIHKDSEKFTNHSNLIIRHLTELESVIEDSFDFLLDNGIHDDSKGYLYQTEITFLKTQFIESKIFEFNIISNLSQLLIESLKSNNDFLYQEIYLMIEPYNVFDRTIEKQTLKELKDINKELSELNVNLVNLNNTLSKGFKMINSQLQSLNNKMFYNNLLTTINTYQLYKISKKL